MAVSLFGCGTATDQEATIGPVHDAVKLEKGPFERSQPQVAIAFKNELGEKDEGTDEPNEGTTESKTEEEQLGSEPRDESTSVAKSEQSETNTSASSTDKSKKTDEKGSGEESRTESKDTANNKKSDSATSTSSSKSNSSKNKEGKKEGSKGNDNDSDSSNDGTEPKAETVSITVTGPPDIGSILSNTQIPFEGGDTVLDILLKTSLRVDYTGRGATAYVQGIDHIYEFDYGVNSGWVASVNGVDLSRSAGATSVKAGDSITWLYLEDYTDGS
nr:DUF4430 domain-containing protein [Bacillus alkalicola]